MKVAGFTFIRNAIRFDYPIVEAITSILPICDYFVVAVGKSEDATLELVRNIGDPKINIIETEWDDALREGGRVLAAETDKALQAIPPEYDWCFYIQGDECIHEADLSTIRAAMERYLDDPQTEGLLFHYRHFFGSYDYIGSSRRWYRREIRIIRNDKRIHSYRDAQGFRWQLDNGKTRKLRVRLIPAHVHHYGWVKHPAAQQQKQLSFNRLWHSDEKVKAMVGEASLYRYDGQEPLVRFAGTHPQVMQARVQAMNWQFASDPTAAKKLSLKARFLAFVEDTTGWRLGEYRNYVEV